MKKVKTILLGSAVICGILVSICGCGKITEENGTSYSDTTEDKKRDAETEEARIEETEEMVSADLIENGLIFSTEYEVEDYCQGCFIISKNDGLLYGVIDMKGEEILPIKYDDIEFLNKDRVKDGIDTILYLQTKYENEYTVINSMGQEILDKKVQIIDYKIGECNSESAFFREDEEEDILHTKFIRFYKEDGTLLSELNCNSSYVSGTSMISPDYYLLSIANYEQDGYKFSVLFQGTYLYDKNNEIVQEWEGRNVSTFYQIEGERLAFYLQGNDGSTEKWLIDSAGNTEYQETFDSDSFEAVVASDMLKNTNSNRDNYNLGETGNIKLYLSNDTWKLEDMNGKALYDDRYYSCTKKEECFLLSNEDNQVCMIDRNGKLIIDYGWLELKDDTYYFEGRKIDSDYFFEGDDGVCFIVKNDNENQVYFFGGK